MMHALVLCSGNYISKNSNILPLNHFQAQSEHTKILWYIFYILAFAIVFMPYNGVLLELA